MIVGIGTVSIYIWPTITKPKGPTITLLALFSIHFYGKNCNKDLLLTVYKIYT